MQFLQSEATARFKDGSWIAVKLDGAARHEDAVQFSGTNEFHLPLLRMFAREDPPFRHDSAEVFLERLLREALAQDYEIVLGPCVAWPERDRDSEGIF